MSLNSYAKLSFWPALNTLVKRIGIGFHFRFSSGLFAIIVLVKFTPTSLLQHHQYSTQNYLQRDVDNCIVNPSASPHRFSSCIWFLLDIVKHYLRHVIHRHNRLFLAAVVPLASFKIYLNKIADQFYIYGNNSSIQYLNIVRLSLSYPINIVLVYAV